MSQAAKAKPSKESEATPCHRYTDMQGQCWTWDNHDLHMKAQTVVLVCAENAAWVWNWVPRAGYGTCSHWPQMTWFINAIIRGLCWPWFHPLANFNHKHTPNTAGNQLSIPLPVRSDVYKGKIQNQRNFQEGSKRQKHFWWVAYEGFFYHPKSPMLCQPRLWFTGSCGNGPAS